MSHTLIFPWTAFSSDCSTHLLWLSFYNRMLRYDTYFRFFFQISLTNKPHSCLLPVLCVLVALFFLWSVYHKHLSDLREVDFSPPSFQVLKALDVSELNSRYQFSLLASESTLLQRCKIFFATTGFV